MGILCGKAWKPAPRAVKAQRPIRTSSQIPIGDHQMAKTEQVQRAVRRVPFTPFTIHIADGRSYLVKHPEQVAVAGGRELVFIGNDERIHEIEMINITEIHLPS
jgi:hypothetical protein